MSFRLTRRSVLKGAAVGLGAAALNSEALGAAFAPPQADAKSFVWVSDTHVGVSRGYDENLAMFRQIRETVKPDFLINGGDVTDYGWPEEYARYQELKAVLPFPVHHIPGNHDVRWSPLGMSIYRKEVGRAFSRLDWEGISIFLVDTTVPLSHWGSISKEQIDWLESGLKDLGREAPVILGMHHWPGRDKQMVDNEAELARLIEPYNVKLILTGHGHSDLFWDWNGAACTMCKGLYQGSWQVQTRRGDNLVVERASGFDGQLDPITTISLKADRAKRRVWAPVRLAATAGGSVALPAGVTEVAWKREEWKPASGEGVKAPAVSGFHVLALKGSGPTEAVVEVADPASKLKPKWSLGLDGGVLSHLRIEDKELYVSTMSGSLYRVDLATGRKVWRSATKGYCHSSPLVAGDKVWVGSADESLHCFDRATGRELGECRTGGPVYSSPCAAKGIIAVGSGDACVYGFHEGDRSRAWKTELPKSQSGFVQSPLATDGSRFYAGAWDSFVYAFDAATGEIVWRAKCCPDMSFLYSPAIGGPVVFGDCVAVPANGNRLYCFDAKTGEKRWEAASPADKFGYSGPAYADGRIVIGCLGDSGEFRCLDAASGEIVWTCRTGEVIYDSTPCVFGGRVAILSTSGLMTVASMVDGTVLAQHRLAPGLAVSSPAASGSVLVAATNNRVAAAFDWRG